MNSKPRGTRVLIVSGDESLAESLACILERPGYSFAAASGKDEARALAAQRSFALALTDLDLSGDSGLELITQLRLDHPSVAALVMASSDDPNMAQAALEAGAYGCIGKPLEANQVLINVANALQRRSLEIENRSHRARLEQMVRDRTGELWTAVAELERAERRLKLSQEETVQRLAIAAEFRDDETSLHIDRMSRYCALLASTMGESAERVETLRLASKMHDVGKIGIPDSILLKPGPLTDDERSIIQRHADMGYRILCDSQSELLNVAATIAHTHHERYDGFGYPRRLRGTAIPLEGRIAAIADVFDALTSDRVYKRAVPVSEAADIMRAERGTHFDPDLLDLFLSSMDAVVTIKAELVFA